MKIAICDDEQPFVENLLKKLNNEFEKHNRKCSFVTTNKGEELLSFWRIARFDKNNKS